MLTRAFLLKRAALMGMACTTVYVAHEPIKRAVHRVAHVRHHRPARQVAHVRRAAPPAATAYTTRTVLECPPLLVGTPGLPQLPLLPTDYSGFTPPYGVPPGYLVPPASPPGVLTPPATPPLAAVPEPATWGTMVLGLGMVGAAMRRRRAVPV